MNLTELLLTAILLVESGGNHDAIGDNGDSIGGYQIQYAYWLDARMTYGSYEDVRDPLYAQQVILRYWDRYAKEHTLEELARLHNGGPNWRNSPKTIEYWEKILNKMFAIQGHTAKMPTVY